jgi:hypothetical protein
LAVAKPSIILPRRPIRKDPPNLSIALPAPAMEAGPKRQAALAKVAGAGIPPPREPVDTEPSSGALVEEEPSVAAIVPDPPPRAVPSKPKLLTIKVPAGARIRSETEFEIGNDVYRLASTEGLGLDTSCEKSPDGRCVFHPRAALKKAILGATLSCTTLNESAGSKLVQCTRTRVPIKPVAVAKAAAPAKRKPRPMTAPAVTAPAVSEPAVSEPAAPAQGSADLF